MAEESQNPFMVSTEPIKIEVEYVDIDGFIIIIRNDDDKEVCRKEGILKNIKAEFRRPSWRTYNRYMKESARYDPISGEQYIDAIGLRDAKLRVLLREIVADGEKLPLDREFFDFLNPDVGLALTDSLDMVLIEEQAGALQVLAKLGVGSRGRKLSEIEEMDKEKLEQGEPAPEIQAHKMEAEKASESEVE